MTELVIIESPYAGDVERNVAYAKACMLDCIKRGEIPFASHLLYTQVLDDDDPQQRKLGIEMGVSLGLGYADKIAFYVDLGISPGMEYAMDIYEEHGIKTETRSLEKICQNQ